MDNICVMCGAELPTECGKQYCAECEESASNTSIEIDIIDNKVVVNYCDEKVANKLQIALQKQFDEFELKLENFVKGFIKGEIKNGLFQ